MVLLKLNVKKQTILPEINRNIVSESVGFVYAKIILDEDWTGLTTKIVVYSKTDSAEILIPENMLVEIPSNFLKPDVKLKFTISGYADNGNKILHTKEMLSEITVFPAGKFIGDNPEKYQPELWEQAVSKINEALDIAEEIQRRADSGEFNGQDYVLTEEDKAEIATMVKPIVDQTYNPESENAQSGRAVAEAVSDKQDSLVSGTNIKTINNQSILGSGNITIEGGSDVEVDQIYLPTSENAQSGKAVAEAITQTLGDIETALDEIIALQEALIGGDIV